MNFHGYLGRPLQRYLDDERVVASDESVTVDQIDFLIAKPTDRPCDGFIGLECTMIFLGFGPTEEIAPTCTSASASSSTSSRSSATTPTGP